MGQAWTKGKLQGEEAMQMLERGVPVWDLLGEKLGKNAAQLQEMASQGKLGREELLLLIDALAERNKGASENRAKTWDGILSNLMDHLSSFKLMVMNNGVFDYMKGRLGALLDLLNEMASDGRLEAWAGRVSAYIMRAFEVTWAVGKGVVDIWREFSPVITRAAEVMGGWRNLALASTLASTALGFMQIGSGAVMALTGIVRFAQAGAALAMANPLLAKLLAVGGAVYAIYDNWDGIVAYFSKKIDRVRSAFDEGC